MKKLILTSAMVFAFIASASADCTVTTDCGDRTYTESSVSASIANNIVTISSNGNVIDTYTCESDSNSVSTSCSGGNGNSNNTGGSFDFSNFFSNFNFSFDFSSFFSF